MPTEAKISHLIIALTRATIDKEMEWTYDDPPSSLVAGCSDVISPYVEGDFKGQKIALYERKYRAFDPESDKWYWARDINLCFLDSRKRVIWEHGEQSSALLNLFNVARDSAAGIDDLLDSLLD